MNAASFPWFVCAVTLDEIQRTTRKSSELDASKYVPHTFSASDIHHESPNPFRKAGGREYTGRLVWPYLEREEARKENRHVC